MCENKISSLISLSLISSPIILGSATTSENQISTLSSSRTSQRRMGYLLATASQLQPMGAYVGQLQEKWQFPSDHLPIGMNLGGCSILSWNVLSADYMDWVLEKDSQGLKRSMIGDLHVSIGELGLTVRDVHIINMIVNTLPQRNLISLQECSAPFLNALRSQLPPQFEIVSEDENAVIIDRNRFELCDVKCVKGVFLDQPQRTFQDITLRQIDTRESIRLLNVHLPGEPNGLARYQFAEYLANTHNPKQTTIAMGDMNFNELEMFDAMSRAKLNYSIYTPYCTNISPFTYNSKAIDHFLVSSPYKVHLNKPEQVLLGLDEMVKLLKS